MFKLNVSEKQNLVKIQNIRKDKIKDTEVKIK